MTKKAITEWRARVGEKEANRVSKAASSRGTSIHKLCEQYVLNKMDDVSVMPSNKEMFDAMSNHLRDHVDNIHGVESFLYSDFLRTAGQVDCIAEYEGELAVIDFKTSEKIKPEAWLENYFVQETFYAAAYYELTGIPVKKLITIMVTPGGDVKVFDKRNKGDYIKLLVRYIKEFVSHNLRTENGE